MSDETAATGRRRAAVARLRAFLDEIDEQTRLPGEKPLREAVADQARERLAELDERRGAAEDTP